MLNFYTTIVTEVVLLMIFLIIMANTDDLLFRNKRKQFLFLFTCIILAILAEWSGSVAAFYGGEFRLIHVWTKVVELSLTPIIPFICAKILSQSTDTIFKKRQMQYALFFHTVLEILSAFGGFIFYVDDKGVFCHGPFYWIYLITYIGATFYALMIGYRVSRKFQNRNKIMLVCMLAFLMFGIVANQIDKSVKSAWLTVAIVVTLLYIFYNDMLQRVDETTMMLNHISYRNHLLRLREPVIIQMFDVDSFRVVNEQYGHIYGDRCLQAIGGIIMKIYGQRGECYRIDGDKFCAILKVDGKVLDGTTMDGKALDGEAMDGKTMDALNEQFFDAMDKCRESDSKFPYVSLGYAKYDPSYGDASGTVQLANSFMYRNKERNKIKHGSVAKTDSPEKRLTSIHELAEKPETASTALDTSELTSRIFTAVAATSERNYIFVCNLDTGVSRWSLAAVKYFGLPGEYMLGAGAIWESYIHPQDRQAYHESIEAIIAGRSRVHEMEYRVRNRMGEYVVCTCRGVVVKGGEVEPDLFAGTIVNHGILDEVDPITNLHSNGAFTKNIQHLIEEEISACIIKVGIENFYHIKAMYGLEGGNQVLRLFGIEIQELIEGKGSVFRLDDANFAFYLYDTDKEEAQKFFRHLRDVAENNIQFNNLRIPLRIYGGAVLLDRGHSFNEYMVRSNLIYAMEKAQESYRSELVFNDDIYQAMGVENIQLHTDIHRSAIDGCRNFFLCYQPIVSFSTGEIIGTEALLRWKQEPYGVVPPGSFIPWLENDPAFIAVGNWILRRAIEETRPLREADPNFVLNVNVSDTQLEYSGFREDVMKILADTGCPPENLCLELTERCRKLDIGFLVGELKFFRSHGIKVAIDDFGTGTSSLNLLIQLPIDELKVDRVFLSELSGNANNRYMIESILQGARKMGFNTCVEGIETREERDLVASLGGDCYQGYYASKPVPIDDFLEFYRKGV